MVPVETIIHSCSIQNFLPSLGLKCSWYCVFMWFSAPFQYKHHICTAMINRAVSKRYSNIPRMDNSEMCTTYALQSSSPSLIGCFVGFNNLLTRRVFSWWSQVDTYRNHSFLQVLGKGIMYDYNNIINHFKQQWLSTSKAETHYP